MRVLIVDDHAVLRNGVKAILDLSLADTGGFVV
jgi:DNA-binding NarL/FixJ family response regulator